jgi:hypothetical protein
VVGLEEHHVALAEAGRQRAQGQQGAAADVHAPARPERNAPARMLSASFVVPTTITVWAARAALSWLIARAFRLPGRRDLTAAAAAGE